MIPSADVPEVYVDESSNSGENLLDVNQPVFTLAGVHVAQDVAEGIVSEVRSGLPASQNEPKYGSLAKSGRGRTALLRAFARLPPGSVRAFFVHKRFMVVTKMVDLLVEPFAHAAGFNLYEDRRTLGLAEVLHMGGPVFGEQDAYDRLLQAFLDWGRQRASTDELFAALRIYRTTVTHEDFLGWVELLEACRGSADEHAADLASGDVQDELDPAVPALYRLCLDFGSALGRFRLIHDESKVISRNAELLLSTRQGLADPARPGHAIEPLPTKQIAFADSKNHPRLQLADWAAGAVRQYATQRATDSQDSFAHELAPVVEPWLIDGIWPAPHADQD